MVQDRNEKNKLIAPTLLKVWFVKPGVNLKQRGNILQLQLGTPPVTTLSRVLDSVVSLTQLHFYTESLMGNHFRVVPDWWRTRLWKASLAHAVPRMNLWQFWDQKEWHRLVENTRKQFGGVLLPNSSSNFFSWTIITFIIIIMIREKWSMSTMISLVTWNIPASQTQPSMQLPSSSDTTTV